MFSTCSLLHSSQYTHGLIVYKSGSWGFVNISRMPYITDWVWKQGLNSSSLDLELLLSVATHVSLCHVRNGFTRRCFARLHPDNATGDCGLPWKLDTWGPDASSWEFQLSHPTPPPPPPLSDLRQIIYFLWLSGVTSEQRTSYKGHDERQRSSM